MKMKVLPSKLVAVKKRKPQETKHELWRVAIWMQVKVRRTRKNSAGGADATVVKCAIRIASQKHWEVKANDVSTAFLRAPYKIKGELLFLKPQFVYVKAGLVKDNEA